MSGNIVGRPVALTGEVATAPVVSPVALSIAILAAFALAWGGGYLMVRRHDRTRGILMLVAALVLVANVLIWTVPI